MAALEKLEKAPLQSKKFLAYLLSNLGSKLLLFWMVSHDASELIIISAVVAAACLDIGYVLGQAALDKYVRIASLGRRDD